MSFGDAYEILCEFREASHLGRRSVTWDAAIVAWAERSRARKAPLNRESHEAIKRAPARYAAKRAGIAKWQAANPDKQRAYNASCLQRIKADPVKNAERKARAAARRREERKRKKAI